MKINSQTGFLTGILHDPSPNFNMRPKNSVPETIIIHAIALPPGTYGGTGIQDLFCNRLDFDRHPYFNQLRGLRVSAHFLIRRDGQCIQFVSLHNRAWHAGESLCLGRENVNDFSIGIELEGCDSDMFTEMQYETLDKLIAVLLAEYPLINRQKIFGHSEIAPERKTDPGPNFDWSRVR